MVNAEVVHARLRALKEYVEKLEANRELSVEQLLAEPIVYYGVQHLLQLASQAAIDIASHVLASDFSRRADQYRDVILALGSEGVLPTEFAHRFAAVAGFRNILIHEYLAVDPEKVRLFLQKELDDFKEFAGYVANYLREVE